MHFSKSLSLESTTSFCKPSTTLTEYPQKSSPELRESQIERFQCKNGWPDCFGPEERLDIYRVNIYKKIPCFRIRGMLSNTFRIFFFLIIRIFASYGEAYLSSQFLERLKRKTGEGWDNVILKYYSLSFLFPKWSESFHSGPYDKSFAIKINDGAR